MNPLLQARLEVLDRIEAAQRELDAAADAASPLRGWATHWQAIDAATNDVRALWHKVNDAPLPTSKDSRPTPGQSNPRLRRPLDSNPKLTDR